MLIALALACTAHPPDTVPVYDPEGASIYDAPWPSDMRVKGDGTIDVSGMDGASEIPLMQTYLDIAATKTGFGNNSPIFVKFTQPINTALLPTAHQSTTDESPLRLIDIDPASPDWGQQVPVHHKFFSEQTNYLPGNLLAVAPVWGYPLAPNTSYALVVTTELAKPNPRFAKVWDADHPDHAVYSDLGDALFFLGLAPDDVAVATVFTTGDPLAEMKRLAHYTQNSLVPPALDQTLTHVEEDDTLWYQVFEGRYQTPVFQHGDRPYAATGGQFEWAPNGDPIVHSWDQMRMAVCTPLDIGNPPPGGWPVVMYAHGTGGDFRSFCSDGSGISQASLFARAGFIGIGVDQPLHGTRATPDTNTNLHWFNYLNPASGTSNFRQSAIDAIYLAHALAAEPIVFHTEDGPDIPINPDELYFMGHSQGGISGAIALPWMGRDTQAAVLSGAGGGLAITIIERKDPVDIATSVETLLQFNSGEVLHELHPVTGLVQWMVEVTDPINYAPYYFAVEGDWDSQRPMSVLISSGQDDVATPHRSASALAGAARAPQISPTFDEPEVFNARDLAQLDPPVIHNAVGYDGTPVTSGLSQWNGGSHWVLFEEVDAAVMYQRFFETARDDRAAEITPTRD